MKTIAAFSKPEEAHLLRMRLEAVGIPAYVQDEYMIQMDWLYSNAIGGVRVQVADNNLEDAREFLAADVPLPGTEKGEVICPSCGSDEAAPDDFSRRISYLSVLLFRFPFVVIRGFWRCPHCRLSFKPPVKVETDSSQLSR